MKSSNGTREKWNPEHLKAQMEREGRTKKWLASGCGIELDSLGQILSGRKPGKPLLKLMAIRLNCDEAALLGQLKRSRTNESRAAV